MPSITLLMVLDEEVSAMPSIENAASPAVLNDVMFLPEPAVAAGS